MRKKIVVPTDFSRNAWNAISYALELFKNEACDFYVLNAYDTNHYLLDPLMALNPGDDALQIAQEQSEKGLAKISQRISFRDEALDHQFFYISEATDLLSALIEIVEKKDIELIVLGTKGNTDASNVAYGSNAVKVMEKIRNCPVLAVPPNVLFTEPNEIVFPTSFRTHFKRKELDHLIYIAQITNAPVRVLHVQKEEALDEIQQNYKALLMECLDGLDYSFHNLDDSNVSEALQFFVQSRGSEMIAFINKKHTFFSSIFSQPMVKKLGASTKVPLLAMHDVRN
jgi:nucleotide-binding universal stress UspA family protein